MISSQYKRMYLIPELTYSSILQKADLKDKIEIETLNNVHKDEGFFARSFEGEPKTSQQSQMLDTASIADNTDMKKPDTNSEIDYEETNRNDQTKDKIKEAESESDTIFKPANVSTPEKVTHTENQTSSRSLRCKKCLKRYQRQTAFNNHKCKGGKPFAFDCSLCNHQFRSKEKLTDHMKKAHKKNYLKSKKNIIKYKRTY